MKGMRVQSIIRELRGEKIDIIEYSEDPVVFATHALSPAKISRVSIVDGLEKHMEVIVDDSQLSLASGRKWSRRWPPWCSRALRSLCSLTSACRKSWRNNWWKRTSARSKNWAP